MKIQQSSDEKYNKIFTILYTVSKDLDLFNTYQVDRILECRIISVSDAARGKGLAKELMKRSIDIAKEKQFKVVFDYFVCKTRLLFFDLIPIKSNYYYFIVIDAGNNIY